MTQQNDSNYSVYYRNPDVLKVYPTEFVIRSFLGSYPNLKTSRDELTGKTILDIGFGDGRNMPLLADLGMNIHGVEVTQEICDHITERMAKVGINIQARPGRNGSLPHADATFDHVLACNSCYYIDPGQTFANNAAEIARVMKPNGLFVHSLPMPTTFIMDDAEDTGNGHMRITQDPYGVRVGAILKKFDNEEQIIEALSPWFTDIRIGSCKDDYWGSKVHLWFVVCRKK
ncbi:MAG: class I SAM-dependent methyltransferase [Alphaproteobacteria bacterium]|nr:MAG: class I SAM-dependent methyltransferase [Alphaproteobacteria bacterium]